MNAPASRRRPARKHSGTRAGKGLPPPPNNIDEAMHRLDPRRRGVLRAALFDPDTAAMYHTLSPAGQRAALAGMAFCGDETAVADLVASEILRDLDPRRTAECKRVARGCGLEFDPANPVHRARVACSWARRQHKARARTRAREELIVAGESYDQGGGE